MSKKISPLEALQKERIRLQLKSESLVAVIEEDFKYLQDNAPVLVGHAVTDVVVSKMPPFIQKLFKKKDSKKETHPLSLGLSAYEQYADVALEFVPFIMKGSKGLIVTMLLKKLKDFFFKKVV